MSLSLPSASASPTFEHFIAPLLPFQVAAKNQYRCHAVTDEAWVRAGLQRVIGQHDSGCAFIQNRVLRGIMNLTKSNYFESCKSPRRYQHLKGLTEDFLHHYSQHALKNKHLFEGQTKINETLKDFHLYAGDGHFHAASSHDLRDNKQRKNAIGHLYALNLRNHHLSHLALGSDGTKKKPHDIGVLKRTDVQALRQGALKGQKVLYIWDRAIIDFQQWSIWKNNNAIYIISRVKESMVLDHPLPQPFDRQDPINAGVLADELVSNQSGTMVRRVTFRVPETGETIQFLTTLGKTVSPGVVAQLYFMRWRIEKAFDTLKNKLHEIKAWALSLEAKCMQAAFIGLAYNLSQLLHEKVEEDQASDDPAHPHRDRASEKKGEKRLKDLKQKTADSGHELPLLRSLPYRATQLSVKFYRWLRLQIYDPSPWRLALSRLQIIYAKY
jgi:Transposase DDE domain